MSFRLKRRRQVGRTTRRTPALRLANSSAVIGSRKALFVYLTVLIQAGMVSLTGVMALQASKSAEATKTIAQETRETRLQKIRPRLMPFSYGDYDPLNRTLSFDLMNVGEGKAFDVTVGLEELTSPENGADAWRDVLTLRFDPPIRADSSRTVSLSLHDGYDEDHTRYDEYRIGNLQAYILYRDSEGTEYLTISPVMMTSSIVIVADGFWREVERELMERWIPRSVREYGSADLVGVSIYSGGSREP